MLVGIIKIQFCKLRVYRGSLIINFFFSILAVYITYTLYSLLLNDQHSQLYLLAYSTLSIVIQQSMAIVRIPEFCKNIKKGTIAKYYKYPVSVYFQFICEEMGNSLYSLLGSGVLMILVFVICKRDVCSIILFTFSLVLSALLAVVFTLNVYSITFLFWNYKSSKAILTALSSLFSGSMIPLVLLPDWFCKIAYNTPFAYMVDLPIRMLLDYNKPVEYLVLQLVWIFVLIVIGFVIYNIVESKINVYGG